MAEYICHGCNRRVNSKYESVYQCDKCGRILCETCREGRYYCKDSSKGKPGCDGRLERVKA